MSDDMKDWDEMMQEPKDKASWINPMDMGLFDSKSQKNCEDLEAKISVCDKELESCQSELEEISKSNGCLNKSLESSTSKPEVEEKTIVSDIFFKRHVRQLINKMQLDDHQNSHLKLEVFLSSEEIATLFKFVSQNSSSILPWGNWSSSSPRLFFKHSSLGTQDKGTSGRIMSRPATTNSTVARFEAQCSSNSWN